ncbi:jg5275 [Pararge aegeria aegeria]|uniref:Jg5275 protein n=1 Tax=Pararge aegeria aegeria TaxID=348720 RepID=A0A8S4RB56_9NEOP|nr:jg5275 [Pararge aegeria aegeria]
MYGANQSAMGQRGGREMFSNACEVFPYWASMVDWPKPFSLWDPLVDLIDGPSRWAIRRPTGAVGSPAF